MSTLASLATTAEYASTPSRRTSNRAPHMGFASVHAPQPPCAMGCQNSRTIPGRAVNRVNRISLRRIVVRLNVISAKGVVVPFKAAVPFKTASGRGGGSMPSPGTTSECTRVSRHSSVRTPKTVRQGSSGYRWICETLRDAKPEQSEHTALRQTAGVVVVVVVALESADPVASAELSALSASIAAESGKIV